MKVSQTDETHEAQISAGERFEFGRNWRRFLSVMNEDRIAAAQRDLEKMLGVDGVRGKTFLDVGSGSGLSSLAAIRLGASRVHSFDFDPHSVACTAELKRRYYPDSSQWTVETGSVLDKEYLQGLGAYDVVYSWGVLHHTGAMWKALENVASLVAENGRLFISIYNDQGVKSVRWRTVKRIYNHSLIGRWAVSAPIISYWAGRGLLSDLKWRRNPALRYREYLNNRGMSLIHDWHDWLGGLPFEVASPQVITDFYQSRGFSLRESVTMGGGLGCNQFVFSR